MQILLKKSSTMAEASKEAKKRLQQELIRELKGLLTDAGLWERLGLQGRVDAGSVLRHTIRILRHNPAVLAPSPAAGAEPPLDLSTHSHSSSTNSGGADAAQPLLSAPAAVFPASQPSAAPAQLTLTLANPDLAVVSAACEPASPLAGLANELESGPALVSQLEARDALALSTAALRLASDPGTPLSLFLRLQSLPLRAVCSAGPSAGQISLSLHLLLAPSGRSSLAFTTRHGASGQLDEVDEAAVWVLGRLPQEMIGTSVLGLIHKDDAPGLLRLHEDATAAAGHRTKAAPLRFLLPSGGLVLAESEWFVQLDPWTRKVAAVMGHHRVTDAPLPSVPAPQTASAHPLQLSFSEQSALESQLRDVLARPPPSRKQRPEAREDCAQQLSSLRDALAAASPPTKRQKKTFFDELIVAAYKESGPPALPRILIPKEGRSGKSSGEEDGCSPPDSHGSGPFSYTYLNTYDKVHRLLQSQPGQPGHSPPQARPEDPAGHTSPPPPSEPLRLTKERLAQHTLHTAREHKEVWKRKYSGDASPTTSAPAASKARAAPPATSAAARTESLSTLRKALEAAPLGSQALEPGEIPSKQPRVEPAPTPSPWALLKPSPDYYRPNPPPAPGRNVEITTLPLSAPSSLPQGSAALSLQALSHQRQIANDAARSLALAPRPFWPPVTAPTVPLHHGAAGALFPKTQASVIQPRAWLPPPPPHSAAPLHCPGELHWPSPSHLQQPPLSHAQAPPPGFPPGLAAPPSSLASAVKEATNALILLQET